MADSTGITTEASQSQRSALESLVALFASDVSQLGRFVAVGTSDLPTSYAALLAHDDHMTVTLEAYHESLVSVVVVDEQSGDDWYARQSLLARHLDGAIVQYGIMRIDLSSLPAHVASAIQSHTAPLGRILIRNNLLRHVELLALWRIEPAPSLATPLGLAPGETIYGRSAAIHLAGKPSVDLLEIVTDHPSAQTTT